MLGFVNFPADTPSFNGIPPPKDGNSTAPWGRANVEAAGRPWIVQSDGKVYSKADPAAAGAGRFDARPRPTSQEQPPIRVTSTETALLRHPHLQHCTDKDTAPTCGAQQLNTKCDKGFYDPIYGGSCCSVRRATTAGAIIYVPPAVIRHCMLADLVEDSAARPWCKRRCCSPGTVLWFVLDVYCPTALLAVVGGVHISAADGFFVRRNACAPPPIRRRGPS
jgi:hypothetical protein